MSPIEAVRDAVVTITGPRGDSEITKKVTRKTLTHMSPRRATLTLYSPSCSVPAGCGKSGNSSG